MVEQFVLERLQELNAQLIEGLELCYSFTDEPLDENKALQAVYSKSKDIEYLLAEYIAQNLSK